MHLMFPGAKKKERAIIKEAFNKWVMELKMNFKSQVSSIALEFSQTGCHYSECQIRNQVIYKLMKPKKICKLMLPNAWVHAKAMAQCLKGKI